MPRSGGITSVCSASLWVSVWFILDSRPQYTNSWCSDMGIRSHSLHGRLSLFTTVLDTSPQTCLAYLVVIGPTYALYRTWGRRRRFWLLMGGVIVIVPPLVSAADYWLLYQRWGLAGPQTVGFGFSGAVSGLVGVLAASTVGSVADWYGRRSAVYVAVALAGSWVIAVLTTTGRSVSRLCAFPLSIGLAIVGIAGIVRQWRSIPVEALQQIHRNQLWVIGTSFLIAWVLTVALFQIEGSVTPRFVNVIAHGTGLLTGINLTIWNGVR